MSGWFFLCVAFLIMVIPLHFKSVEYTKLQQKYGKERGTKIGRIYGIVSGTIESILLVGLWFLPQPTFSIPLFSDLVLSIANFSIPILHLIISLPLIVVSVWFGIGGVRIIGLDVAETHCLPKEIVTSGVYSIVRHPQYFGWFLAHIGISVLLSVQYSLIFTPMLFVVIYLISRKEEDELINEFGKEYEYYRRKVPMIIPRLK